MITLKGDERNVRSWELEVHPLVQAGVRRELIINHPYSWRKANKRVYLSITRSVRESQPDDKKSLRILYSAVPHGVNAGQGRRAGWMYARRCLRFFKGYSTAQGLIAEDVALIANYFEGNWLHVKEHIGLDQFATTQAQVWGGLSQRSQSDIRGYAGHRRRPTGRPQESLLQHRRSNRSLSGLRICHARATIKGGGLHPGGYC